MTRVRLHWEVAWRTFRRSTTYRGATIAGVFTNTAFGFIMSYVLLAVYEQRDLVGGFDAVDSVTFVFVTQGLLMVVGAFGETELGDRIKTGDVVTDLYRPTDLQSWWAAVFVGKAMFFALFRGIPPFAVGAIAFDLRIPSVGVALAFAGSVALAVLVASQWHFLVQLSAFWLLDARGPNQLAWLVAQFLSGVFIPLVFLPDWLETIARALPFASLIQLPVEVFLGKHLGADVFGIYAQQAAWAVALALAGRAVLGTAVRKVVIQGG
jgi:ABC-2 type transport system permease protein